MLFLALLDFVTTRPRDTVHRPRDHSFLLIGNRYLTESSKIFRVNRGTCFYDRPTTWSFRGRKKKQSDKWLIDESAPDSSHKISTSIVGHDSLVFQNVQRAGMRSQAPRHEPDPHKNTEHVPEKIPDQDHITDKQRTHHEKVEKFLRFLLPFDADDDNIEHCSQQ